VSAALVAARGWLSLSEAATYLGVSSDYLRGAVADGRLRAYRKPYTSERRKTSQPQVRLRMSKEDLDAFVREEWEEA